MPVAACGNPVRKAARVIAAAAVFLSAVAAFAQAVGAPLRPGGDHLRDLLAAPPIISASAVPQYTQAVPGQSFDVAMDVRILEGWAYYSPTPGKSKLGVTPMPGVATVEGGKLNVGKALWPAAHPYGDGTWVYKHRAIVILPVAVPAGLPQGKYDITWRLSGQVCNSKDGACVPLEGDRDVRGTVSLQVGSKADPNPAWGAEPAYAAAAAAGRSASAPASERTTAVWLALALLAGLILNVMPCVLPVIPLRIYSIVKLAGQSRRRYVTLGLTFAMGIVLFFVAIAAVNAGLLLVEGKAFRWSEQWQRPGVIVGMAMVLVAVAANLFGLFDVAVPRKIAAIEARDEGSAGGAHLRSVGMGLMMAVLATPCSFGLLLAVLAWAQAQPAAMGTLAFIFVGLGMATPHALLAAFPSLVDRLPRPGRWMELFRQSMGFVLLLVAVWVISWLGDNRYPFWAAGYGVVLAFCLWVWGRWVRYDAPTRRKVIVRGLAVVLAVAAGCYSLRPEAAEPEWAIRFRKFDEAGIHEARQSGRIVVIDFTAQWCASCKIVDLAVYRQRDVADAFQGGDVYAVRGDVTLQDMPAAEFLKRYPDLAVPVTAVYLPGRPEPVFLKGKFDKSELLRLIQKRGS